MKYDLNKKQTIAAKRTLNSVTNAMFKLLESKSFESITVQELCDVSLIPRATFYNYFEDKYDLLNYCWYTLKLQIAPEISEEVSCERHLELFLSQAIDFLDSYKERVYLILKNNDIYHYLVNNFRIYLTKNILEAIKSCPCSDTLKIPFEILARHYCNAVLTILEWKYIEKNECLKEEAIDYLKVLLNQ